MRDALASSVRTWLAAMFRAVVQAKEAGHLAPDTDEQQMSFEIHGLILALHYEARFLHNPGTIDRALRAFEFILARYAATPDVCVAGAKPGARVLKSVPSTSSPRKGK